MLIAFCSDGPVIEQEQTHIKTSAGEEIHITCVVHAFPPPLVTWTRYLRYLSTLSIDWCSKFPRDGRLLSENSEGVVMSQADNRYNLILLGSHLSHPQSGNSSCQTFIYILSFHFLFALHCSVNKKALINRKLNFSIGAKLSWVNLPWQCDGEIMWVL